MVVVLIAAAAAAVTAAPAFAKPSQSFGVSAAEGLEADGVIPVTVTRSVKSSAAVYIATSDNTATASNDYTPVSRIVTFRGGRNSAVVNIPITDDAVAEPDQDFTVTLSSPSAGAGLSTPSASVTIDNDDAPGAPTNVGATAVSYSRIDLSWDPASDYVTDWDVYRSSTVSGSEAFVGNTTTNSYSDTGLDSSTTYYYYVIAKNGIGGGSPQSGEVSATTDSCGRALNGPIINLC